MNQTVLKIYVKVELFIILNIVHHSILHDTATGKSILFYAWPSNNLQKNMNFAYRLLVNIKTEIYLI